MTTERLGVIGVGYVGLVTAACFAQAGHDVVCLDIDEAKLERLRAGEAPIHEPGVEELLAGNRERLTLHRRRRPSCSTRADIAFVCVDTPPSASGDADLSRVEAVLDAIPAGTRRRRARHEVDRAAGHGARAAPHARRARPARRRLRLESRVPARGQRDRRLPAPRPRRRGRGQPEVGERIAALYRPSAAPS